MASTAEPSPYSSRRRDESEFNLRDWAVKARISRENTNNSRRYSGSYMRSFREDTRSFRSNITISSTASSPGYPLKDEIDPSTYSFTTALKALQARASYNSWECLSPDGFALNSKWNEAERYICNPLSGEVPLECLSAKTLSGRSFRNSTNRIAMSAPLVYSSKHIPTKPATYAPEEVALQFPNPENKKEGKTRDVGTQSTPPYLSSSSPSPASTPSIIERSKPRPSDSPNSSAKTKSEEGVEMKDEETWETKEIEREKNEEEEQLCKQSGCFSWMKKKRHQEREKERQRRNNIFLTHFKEQDITSDGSASNPWRLCTVDQVEELKVIIKVMTLWLTRIMMSLNIGGSFGLVQAKSLNRHITSHFQVPRGSFGVIMVVIIFMWIAIYDRVILPLASKIRGKHGHSSPSIKDKRQTS